MRRDSMWDLPARLYAVTRLYVTTGRPAERVRAPACVLNKGDDLVASVCLLISGDRDPETTHELVQRALAAAIADLTRAPEHFGA